MISPSFIGIRTSLSLLFLMLDCLENLEAVLVRNFELMRGQLSTYPHPVLSESISFATGEHKMLFRCA